MTQDEAEARRVEELLLNSTRPAEQLEYDGWLLWLAPHDVKRASSINPIYGSPLPLDDKIAHCEHVYEQHGLPPLFRISRFSQPASTDDALSARGYERFERSISMSVALDDLPFETRSDLHFELLPAERWLELVSEMRGLTQEKQRAEHKRLVSSSRPGFAVVAWGGNQAVGCGLIKIEDSDAGIFDVATAAAHRRRGIGRATCVHLMQLARQNGAERVWLSVVADNEPALQLYEKLGFRPCTTTGTGSRNLALRPEERRLR